MNSEKKIKSSVGYLSLLTLESIILIFLFSLFINSINGGLGTPNVTLTTYLTVGQVGPDVFNVTIDGGNTTITLNPNGSRTVKCDGIVRDFNNETDIAFITAEFYSNTSSYGASDDNNTHYTNASCNKSLTFGSWSGFTDDNYTILANCTFQVQYYADPTAWNCTMFANDSAGWNATGNDTINISELLAIDMPTTINYGIVNATSMSNENITNISNVGNVKLNLSLKGWAVSDGDNWAMNCTLGAIKNISIAHEKFNLTNSTPGSITLAQAVINYTNLSSSAVIRNFGLDYRRQDSYNDATNASYWRIYVPLGVAGSCQGNIQFGATKATGS